MDFKADRCAMTAPREDVLLHHPAPQAWPKQFQREGALLFLLEYFPIISFQCHATCMCATGTRSALFTAKLVFTSEQGQASPALMSGATETSCMCLLNHSNQYRSSKTQHGARQKETKAKLLWESQPSGERGSGAVKGVRTSSHSGEGREGGGGKSAARLTLSSRLGGEVGAEGR